MGGPLGKSTRTVSLLSNASTGMRLSEHVQKVRIRDASAEQLSSVLSKIDDPGVLAWMKRNPIGELVFAKKTSEGGNGAYNAKKNRLQLGHERDPSKFGREYKPGKTFSVSQLGKTREDAIAGTMLHEIGHHVWKKSPDSVRSDARSTFDKLGDRTFTKYGRVSASEHFSESFSAYFRHPKLLKRESPEAYRMISRAVKSAGIR